MKNIKAFEQFRTFNKYVYKYDDYFYDVNDVEGDTLVSDIEDATVFSEKRIRDLDMDSVMLGNEIIGQVMWCDDVEIEIVHPFEKIMI